MTPVRLQVRNLAAQTSRRGLFRELSLEVDAGEVVAITGANGTGKSTLLDMIAGVQAAAAGEIWFDGRLLSTEPPWKRARLGMGRLYQDSGTFGGLTVSEALRVGRAASGHPDFLPHEAQALLASLGATLPLDQMCGALSIGQQRLVSIARVVATEPRLMLLDEPAAGLSPQVKDSIAAALNALCRPNGCALVLVEHDRQLIELLGARELVLTESGLRAP